MDYLYELDFQIKRICEITGRAFPRVIGFGEVGPLFAIDKTHPRFIKNYVIPNFVDFNPFWDVTADWGEKHQIRFNTPFDDSCFSVDLFDATSAEGDPFIGLARLPLRNLVLGGRAVMKKLVLKDPSGRPIGEVTVMVAVRRVQNPLPPERTVTIDYGERAAEDEFDENDMT